jgi:hypothetical protein
MRKINATKGDNDPGAFTSKVIDAANPAPASTARTILYLIKASSSFECF